jgi:AraC-like DNA-binding protein
MDVLSDVLRAVRLKGAVFFDMEAHSPWVGTTPPTAVISSLVMPEAEHVICFHVLTDGACWAELADHSTPPVRLQAGDVIIVAKGDAHFLCSSPGMVGNADLSVYERPLDRPLPLPHVLNETSGAAETCRFVCGYLGCDQFPFNPLLDALPRMFRARASTSSQTWLQSLLRTAVDETGDDKAGRETLLARLAELLFVDVLRKHVAELPPEALDWFSGLRDRQIGAALAIMHARPAADWALKDIAREVGLSRSSFAERFVAYVGKPPMEYLARWRVQLASRLLEQGATIIDAAEQVGYGSEAALSRVFKRYAGMAPGEWRRSRSARTRATILAAPDSPNDDEITPGLGANQGGLP